MLFCASLMASSMNSRSEDMRNLKGKGQNWHQQEVGYEWQLISKSSLSVNNDEQKTHTHPFPSDTGDCEYDWRSRAQIRVDTFCAIFVDLLNLALSSPAPPTLMRQNTSLISTSSPPPTRVPTQK